MRQYVEFSKYFASRGGQCLILTIRLLKDYGSVPDKWKEMVDRRLLILIKTTELRPYIPALRDIKAAVRWVVANKNNFGINTNQITVGGGSAGGCASLVLV